MWRTLIVRAARYRHQECNRHSESGHGQNEGLDLVGTNIVATNVNQSILV